MGGHRSHRGAVERCCPGQDMGGGNEASTHSRGTRPAVPLQLGLTLKRIRLVLPVCFCVCVCAFNGGALGSIVSVALVCISPSAWIFIK